MATSQPMTPEEVEKIRQQWQAAAADSFLTFARGLTVPTQDQGPQLFDRVWAEFQREFFEDIAPSLEQLRNGQRPDCQRWWIERTKKASKDGDLAIILLWLLTFPRRPFQIQIGAADAGQAAIVKDRMSAILHYNRWLRNHIRIQAKHVIGAGGLAKADILAAEEDSAHGPTPDLLVLNELSHIRKWEFAEAAKSNADGVARGLMIVATNAGFKGSHQEKWKRNAETSDRWRCHVLARPAPWTSEENLEDARATMPPGQYSRLWWGKWSSGKGDAVSEQDIDACFQYGLKQMDEPASGWWYVAGLDLGTKRDHAGLAILGVSQQERVIRLAWMKGWEPSGQDHEVPLAEVEAALVQQCRKFRVDWCGYDPHQAVYIAQRGKHLGLPMVPVPFVPANLGKMASAFTQALAQKWLQCYDDDRGTLRRDFGKFSIIEKNYGVRLEAIRDSYGHADVGTALLIGLMRASELLNSNYSRLMPDDDLIYSSGPLDATAWANMPQEFKELLGSEGPTSHRDRFAPVEMPDWTKDLEL